VPDIVIQFDQCLDVFNGDFPSNTIPPDPHPARTFVLKTVVQLIEDARASLASSSPLLGNVIPAIPVVNSICVNGTERLGVNLINNFGPRDNNGNTLNDRSQIAELQKIQPAKGVVFSVQVTPQGFNRVLNEVWTLLTSKNKRLNGETPDPKGQTELDSFVLGLTGNISLLVDGIYHTQFQTAPDVPFTVLSTDTYSIQPMKDGNSVRGTVFDQPNESISPSLSALKAYEDELIAAALLTAGLAGNNIALYVQGQIDSQISSALTGFSFLPSVGSLFQSIFINQVLVPNSNLKLVMDYTSVTVDPVNGLVASTTKPLLPVPRNPAVVIVGPQVIYQDQYTNGSSIYCLVLTDIDSASVTSIQWSGTVKQLLPKPGEAADMAFDEIVIFKPVAGNGPAYQSITVEVFFNGIDNAGTISSVKATVSVHVLRIVATGMPSAPGHQPVQTKPVPGLRSFGDR